MPYKGLLSFTDEWESVIFQRVEIKGRRDSGDDDDDVPQLSAEAMAALAEFYSEKNTVNEITIDEDWQVCILRKFYFLCCKIRGFFAIPQIFFLCILTPFGNAIYYSLMLVLFSHRTDLNQIWRSFLKIK